MNPLGAITIDLIEQMKAITKGWSFHPLVNSIIHSYYGYLSYKPTPPRTSPIDFFKEHHDGKASFILVKRPKMPLRLIELRPTERQDMDVLIRMYVAAGYVHYPAVSKRERRIFDDLSEDMHILKITYIKPVWVTARRKFEICYGFKYIDGIQTPKLEAIKYLIEKSSLPRARKSKRNTLPLVVPVNDNRPNWYASYY